MTALKSQLLGLALGLITAIGCIFYEKLVHHFSLLGIVAIKIIEAIFILLLVLIFTPTTELTKDYATLSMLQWFVDEQVEEEATAQDLVDSLEMIKDNGFGIYTLDRELKSRKYTPLASND